MGTKEVHKYYIKEIIIVKDDQQQTKEVHGRVLT